MSASSTRYAELANLEGRRIPPLELPAATIQTLLEERDAFTPRRAELRARAHERATRILEMRRGFGGERVEPYYHERHKLGRRPRLRKGPTDTLPNSRYGFAGEVCWWGELYENRSDRVVMEWLRLDAHAAVRFDKEYVELERFTYDGPLLRSYVCVRETWMWWHEQYSYAGERLIEVRLAGSNEPTGEIFHEVHRLSYDGDELVRVDADALDWGVTIRLL